jgi:pantoate--beta-alanine ligase
MGGLHQGHLSLIDLAKKNADKVVVSIFVNPTQFAQHEDFGTYPRTMDADLAALELSPTDLVFIPNTHDIYPDNAVFNLCLVVSKPPLSQRPVWLNELGCWI